MKLLYKTLFFVFLIVQLSYVLLVKLPRPTYAIVTNLSSGNVTLSNPRLSYRGMLQTASSANDTKFTVSATPVAPATDSNTSNLFINDVICFNNPSSNGCASQTTYTVNAVPTSTQFVLSAAALDAMTAGTAVIATQSARWTVTFTPRTPVPSGGFLRLIIPNTGVTINDGIPDSGGFDSNKLTTNNINAAISPTGFTKSATTLTTNASVSTVVLMTLSSALTAGTSYSFVMGDATDPTLRFINPSPASSSHTAGKADTYPMALQSEDAGNNVLDKIIMKVAPVDDVQVSVSIGGGGAQHKFFLYGYTSPFAQVYLEGIGIIAQTTADKTGYFSLDNNLSPLLPREACLSAKDQLGRRSSPTCLPAFPLSYDVNIGPVLLSPTLSLNKPQYYTGEEVVISGQTIPNTDVILSLFVDSSKKSLIDYLVVKLNPIKSVFAFGFPDLQTKTDNEGNYSLTIPSAKSDLFRLFASALYDKQSTPQSARLSLKILPIWWMFIVNLFILLWFLLQPHLLEIIILVQIVVFMVYLLRQFLSPHILASDKSLMIQEKHPITVHE